MTQIHSKNKTNRYIKNLKDRSHSTNIDSRRERSFYNPIKGLMQTFKNKQDNQMISKNQTMVDAYIDLEEFNNLNKKELIKLNYKPVKTNHAITDKDLNELTNFVSVNRLEVESSMKNDSKHNNKKISVVEQEKENPSLNLNRNMIKVDLTKELNYIKFNSTIDKLNVMKKEIVCTPRPKPKYTLAPMKG